MSNVKSPRIDRIRVPNPFVEGRTCVYVLRTDPVTLIDTGIATDKAYQGLVEGLSEHGLTPADIRRVILTHKHIDHIGNAWKFQHDHGADIFIHESETTAIEDVDPSGQRFAEIARRRLDDWQVPADDRPETSGVAGPHWTIQSARVIPLVDGQRLPTADGDIEVLHTPGHTMGSVCFRHHNILFSGDHVLPDISPNVGGGDLKNRGLLSHYLDSLTRIRDVTRDERLLVMPGHGEPMESITERCNELIQHHEDRLDEIVSILQNEAGLSVFELANRLFGTMKDFHVILGCAEAYSHLELLIDQSRVVEQQMRFSAV